MARQRLHPAHVSVQHALGNFLPYFKVAGVIISCLHQGNVYHFAQWSTQWGKIMALGQCWYLDPVGYPHLWFEAPTGGPVAGTGIAADLTGLTDEAILKRFCQLVDCDGAILQYNTINIDDMAFWRWRNKVGQTWATKHCTRQLFDSHQPLANEISWKNQTLSPATYAEVVRVTGHDTRLANAVRGRRWGWDEQKLAEQNNNNRNPAFNL